ncbi:MAG: TetR family transcriptional regulator [Deltaproteobacteria bacterium]|nr:TetR family transcriptional regulator [Deltaproteobacteria bacterium]
MNTTMKTSTRDEIIRKGAELIHARGYKATGIQQILDAVGIPKGSFYFYFKSKDDFGSAVIDHFALTIGDVFSGHLRDDRKTPLVRLSELLGYYESAFQKSGATLGCPIGNLSLELADANEALRKRLQAAVEGFIAEIEFCLMEAKSCGQLPAGLDTADSAHFIFHGLEGAILHMKVSKSIEPLHAFRRYLNIYLAGGRTENA